MAAGKLRHGHGLGEQIALALGAAFARKELPLRFRLDAFGEHGHAEALAQSEHRAHDRGCGRILRQTVTKDWSSLILSKGKACSVAREE